jgi:hypothetical protein
MILKNLSVRSAFSLSLAVVFALSSISCKEKTKQASASETVATAPSKNFKLSLAQWSIHKMINEGGLDPYAFAEKAHDWGFEGLEYVSQLYNKELQPTNYGPEAMANFVAKSLAESEKYGMQNLLIMIDGQGNLATTDTAERQAAVENHYKWVDAAAALGCHSVRVNLAGSNDPEVWIPAATDGLSKLATYAATKNINVIVENHGDYLLTLDYWFRLWKQLIWTTRVLYQTLAIFVSLQSGVLADALAQRNTTVIKG